MAGRYDGGGAGQRSSLFVLIGSAKHRGMEGSNFGLAQAATISRLGP